MGKRNEPRAYTIKFFINKEILQKINNNFKCIGGFRYGKVLAKGYGVEIE